MKNSFKLFLSLMLHVFIFACDPPKESVTPEPEIPENHTEGTATPVGTAAGTANTATLGPAGGTIESADKRIRVTIPAGALPSDQQISIQPVTNNCPAGSGMAFRLSPHGITFAKPVTISFKYEEQDVKNTIPAALRIAFQNERGIWQAPVVKSLDTTAHQLAVETRHFSDWGVFKKMYIEPVVSFLNPGEHIELSVYEVPDSQLPDDDIVIGIPKYISSGLIEKWTLNGSGDLRPQGNRAQYQAPSSIPATNPAAATVFLNKTITMDGVVFKDIRLVSNIYVVPEGLSLQIDGGAWRTYPAGVSINSSRNVVLGKDGAETASVGWKGAPTGTFHWTKGIDVSFNLNKGKLVYQHLYGKGPSVSGGSLTVDNSDATWVAGTFTVQPAGWLDTGTQVPTFGTATIRGVFKVKRVK